MSITRSWLIFSKYSAIYNIFANIESKICKILNTPQKICPRFLKLCQSFVKSCHTYLIHFRGKVFLHNCWSGVGHFFLTSVRRYAFMPLKSHLIFSTSSTPYSDHHFLGGDESKKQFLSRFNQDHKCSFKRI